MPDIKLRNVLLCVTGLSPQVVTETLYALATRDVPWVPTEIRVITTARGADNVRLNLLSEEPGWFHKLCADYQLPAIAFDAAHVHTIPGADGRPLQDISTDEDNRRAADFIADQVRAITLDPTSSLHASLAGGRKTMGYYLGYALSLFGRPQDCLSHVLVSSPYESLSDFYYPSPYERVIHTRDKSPQALDCAKATVQLSEIPFVRLREGFPERLLNDGAPFTTIIEAANRALEPPLLRIHKADRRVIADDCVIDMGPTEKAVLLWFAQRARENRQPVDWAEISEVEEFLDVARAMMGRHSGPIDNLEKAIQTCQKEKDPKKALRDYFEPHKSRINKALKKGLGVVAARRYGLIRVGSKGYSQYELPLEPGHIEIIE
ncbi:MAG: CRISPR-associated ring nuclease Csm6 [Burkholderiales bacterium]